MSRVIVLLHLFYLLRIFILNHLYNLNGKNFKTCDYLFKCFDSNLNYYLIYFLRISFLKVHHFLLIYSYCLFKQIGFILFFFGLLDDRYNLRNYRNQVCFLNKTPSQDIFLFNLNFLKKGLSMSLH